MDYVRSACGAWRIDRVRNFIVHEICRVKKVNRSEGRRKYT